MSDEILPVRLPLDYQPNPKATSLDDGSATVDLGSWKTPQGIKRFALRMNVQRMAPMIGNVMESGDRSIALCDCLDVFCVDDGAPS